ncbi:MAG: NifU family protein [Flavobacteriales bacterium]|nr:NifU family protein [Flavobacteriales bacterium]
MEATPKMINVFAESTPNPASLKFVADFVLVPGHDSFEYLSKQDAANSPLATELFNFPFVKGVFIASNFVTITKNDFIEWHEIMNEMRMFIKDFLLEGKDVVTGATPNVSSPSKETEAPIIDGGVEVDNDNLTDLDRSIMDVLDQYVRPAVEGDGGAINFKSFEDGVVTVILRGACSGCPSSTVTLKSGIEALLQKMIPEVKEVVAEER